MSSPTTKPQSDKSLGQLIAPRFGSSRFLQGYIKGKIAADPAYDAVFQAVANRSGQIIDLGCGLGLLGHYLRARGVTNPILGIEPDAAKIQKATAAASAANVYLQFAVGKAEDPLPNADTFVLLDILHYMTPAAQRSLLDGLAKRVAVGAMVLIRNGIRDASWRYKVTVLEELWVRTSRWIPVSAPICFPTIPELTAPFEAVGASIVTRPLWAKTPFNSYWCEFETAGAEPASSVQ